MSRFGVFQCGAPLLFALACSTGSEERDSSAPVAAAPDSAGVEGIPSQPSGASTPTGAPSVVSPTAPVPQGAPGGAGAGGSPVLGAAGMPTLPPSNTAGVGGTGATPSVGGGGAAGESPVDAGAGGADDAGGGCSPFVMPDDCTVPEGAVLPGELRCTGLYSDWEARDLQCDVQVYTPAYTLWSDGSDKQRYFSIPAGNTVDMSDPDDFRYPLGTKFWKEFRAPESTGGRLLETRLLERVDGGWLYTSYVWSEDETTAVQNNDGVADLHGTGHTVPARQQCKECHSGRPDFVLGWDAISFGSGASGVTRDSVALAPWATWEGKDLGNPPPLEVTVPGDETERAALGYLHANCGVSCHNDTTDALALETGLFTRLDSESLGSVQETPTFSTGYLRTPSPNAPLMELIPPEGGYVDLRPLDTEGSLLLVRMQLRNVDAAMPRIGTNLVDEQGVALVQSWIEGMTEERGYPAP